MIFELIPVPLESVKQATQILEAVSLLSSPRVALLTRGEHLLPGAVGRVQGEGELSFCTEASLPHRRPSSSVRAHPGQGRGSATRPLLRPRCPGDRASRPRARAVAHSGALWDGNTSGAYGPERAAAAGREWRRRGT